MNAAVDPGAFVSVFMMLFSGFGLPLGVPPEPEDPLLANVAPAECLFYTTWAGMAEPDPDSENQVEQLLAEPEIRQMLATLEQQLGNAVARNVQGGPPVGPMAELAKIVLTSPSVVFVESVEPGAEGLDISGGLLVRADEQVDALVQGLEGLQEAMAGDQVQKVSIGDAEFYQLRPSPQMPIITWGARGRYVVIGVGEGSVQAIFERARKDPPEWLVEWKQQAAAEAKIERISTLTYVDVAKIRGLLLPLAPPNVGLVVDALGLMEVDQLGTVGGLDATGFANFAQLGIDGQPRGLLVLADVPGLEASDLQPIPDDALVGLAFRLDAGRLLDTVNEILTQVEPRAAQEMQSGIEQIEQELGFQVREQLLEALGDVWTLSTAESEGGLLTGWLATVQLDDRDAFLRVHEQFRQAAEQAVGRGLDAPLIREAKLGDQTAYTLVVPDDDFPLNPAWCVTDTHLVFSLFPQALKSFLARDDDADSLAAVPQAAALLASDPPPLKMVYVDTQQVFRQVYPLIQIGLQVGLSQLRSEGAIDLDPFLVPSLSAIEPHLIPSVMAVRRTASGLVVVSQQSTPGISLGTTVPTMVAMLLPAVQASRSASRRMQSINNMKQIGLALHNYHDTCKAFPPAYSADADGKPLLSWRVYILPFVEQRRLYDEFHTEEPWDSPHNRKLIARMPEVYAAPGSTADPGKTVYLGVRGEDNVLIPPRDVAGGRLPVGAGMATIIDGTSNTIMVVEASDAEAVIWSKPDDYEPDAENPIRGLVGLRPGGFNALFADGSVQFLAESIDLELLKNLFTKNDRNPVNIR